MKRRTWLWIVLVLVAAGCSHARQPKERMSGNPILEGWYADPEGAVFGKEYWIFPTYSSAYRKQLFFDAFSSKDLVRWVKHEHVLDTSIIKWAKQAMWAPAAMENDKKIYLFFSANDVQRRGSAAVRNARGPL